MSKGRGTTKSERLAVAKACIAYGKNYGEVAIAYNVSYRQARRWTLKYIDGGEALQLSVSGITKPQKMAGR